MNEGDVGNVKMAANREAMLHSEKEKESLPVLSAMFSACVKRTRVFSDGDDCSEPLPARRAAQTLCAGMKQKCDLKDLCIRRRHNKRAHLATFRWNQQLDEFRRVNDVEAVLAESADMKRLRVPPDRNTVSIVLNASSHTASTS